MTEPTFGISITPVDNETRAASTADMSVIGLIGTASDANAGIFPLNTPVLMTSDDAAKITALGAADDLANAVGLIAANTGASAARIIVVRVAKGVSNAATMANIIGSAGSKTGLHAFKEAGALLSVTPRLICVAGAYTGIIPKGISGAVTAPGSGGANGTFDLAFSGGAGSGAAGTFTVTAGAVSATNITNPGNYTAAPTAVLTASTGLTGATVTLSLADYANPVVAALGPVLDDLTAIAPVSGPNVDQAKAQAWRGFISSKRIVPIDNDHLVQVGEGLVTVTSAASFCGLQVLLDDAANGVPSKAVANRSVQGIVSTTRNIRFSLTDGSTEGQVMLADQIGITVAGSSADGALADSGFVMVVTDNAGDDDLWRFYHQVRMRDYIHLAFVRSLRRYLGRYPLTGHAIQGVLNSMTELLGDLQRDDHILGFEVGYSADENAPANLRLGKFNVFFKAEEPPLLRHLGVKSYRYVEALDDLLAKLAA